MPILQYTSDDNLIFFHHTIDEKRQPTDDNYYCQPRIHDDQFEIHYLIKGNAEYYIEGKEYELFPGDVICIPKGLLHSVKADLTHVHYDRYVLQFSESILPNNVSIINTLYKNLSDSDNPAIRILKAPIVKKYKLEKFFIELEKYGLKKDKYFYPTAIVSIINFLIEINKILEKEALSFAIPAVQNATIQKMLDYLQANIEGDVSIKTVAKELYLHEDYLSHLFREHMGISFKQYADIKKMRRAADLIDSGHKPTEVAERLGYLNYSTFYQRFVQVNSRKPSLKIQRYVSNKTSTPPPRS